MKYFFFIIFFLSTLTIFGQNLIDKVGDIEICFIEHRYKRNSEFELTNKKSNNQNRPGKILYLNAKGLILKKISFGKHHNNDLKLIDNIIVYEYSGEKLIGYVKYESDYDKTIYPYWKTKLIYNSDDQITDELVYYFKNDSLFHKTTFEYDDRGNKTNTIFTPSHYFKREADSVKKITSLQQIYDNKLRWEWTYSYNENKRSGNFQTFYNDGSDYSETDIQSFDKNKLLIEHETVGRMTYKTKFFYYENGIPKRIEYYELNGDNKYHLISYTDIKIKAKLTLTPDIVKNIKKDLDFK